MRLDRVRTFGLAACGGVLVIALVPAMIAAGRTGPEPPETVPRWLALGLVFALPAIIGAVGVRRRDRALLLGAAVSCLPVMPLSIATLPLLVPAILFVIAASATATGPRPATAIIAAAVVALSVGSLVALLTTTETSCWLAYEGTEGPVYRPASEAETRQPMGGPGGPMAGGCDSGTLSIRGLGLAGVLEIGAVGLAVAAPRPRPATA